MIHIELTKYLEKNGDNKHIVPRVQQACYSVVCKFSIYMHNSKAYVEIDGFLQF